MEGVFHFTTTGIECIICRLVDDVFRFMTAENDCITGRLEEDFVPAMSAGIERVIGMQVQDIVQRFIFSSVENVLCPTLQQQIRHLKIVLLQIWGRSEPLLFQSQ